MLESGVIVEVEGVKEMIKVMLCYGYLLVIESVMSIYGVLGCSPTSTRATSRTAVLGENVSENLPHKCGRNHC
jgi:hypothetical protein